MSKANAQKEGNDSIWIFIIDASKAFYVNCQNGSQQVEEQLSQKVSKCYKIELEKKALRSGVTTLHSVMKK